MESVWWVFAEVYKKGLIYQGYKVMPFSAKLGTPLSNFEANLNYRDVDDPSLTVLFPLLTRPDVSFVVWTTTPWTLPSNLALTLSPNLSYVELRDRETGKSYILAEARLFAYFDDTSRYEITARYSGQELANIPYEPLFSYFTEPKQLKAFRPLPIPLSRQKRGQGSSTPRLPLGRMTFMCARKQGSSPFARSTKTGNLRLKCLTMRGNSSRMPIGRSSAI